MVSLRFPFSFSQPSRWPLKPQAKASFSQAMAGSVALAAGLGICVGLTVSQKIIAPRDPLLQPLWEFFCKSTTFNSSLWGSLSLASGLSNHGQMVVESRTGVSFPPVLSDNQRLLGVGLRKKSIFGLKNINVYAFGVYADDSGIKGLLHEKYGKLPVAELKQNEQFYADVLDQDICMTIRIEIVYGRLSIGSVRSAFEESVGSRFRKLSGIDNKELLQRFTSQFKNEYKLKQGSLVHLSRERGHVLHTKIDGKEVGSIESKLLCRSIFDLYMGEDPFDRPAKEDIGHCLASLLLK